MAEIEIVQYLSIPLFKYRRHVVCLEIFLKYRTIYVEKPLYFFFSTRCPLLKYRKSEQCYENLETWRTKALKEIVRPTKILS